MFDNDFLASSNQMKLCTTDYIFPIKQDDICDYNTLCFMSSGLMLDDIIINIYTENTKNQRHHIRSIFFSPDSRMIQFTCTKDICRILHGKGENTNTRRTLRLHHYIEIEKLRKYLSGILYIENDKADLGKNMDQFINDKSDFNNKNIIKSNNQPVSKIPE